MRPSWMLLLSVAVGGLFLGVCATEDNDLTELPDPGPCIPPINSSALVGLRGYRRYFANDSLIGRPVPCTREDKICFRHNLVFNSNDGYCDHLGGGHDIQCDLRPDRSQFEHGSGRIIGVCKTFEDPCPGYRMAFDGRCYRKEVVRDVICGCGAKPTRHFLDGVVCRSSPASPVPIQQPKDESRCLIPDLRFPDIKRSKFFRNPFREYQGFQEIGALKCNSDQAACFEQKKVWVSGATGCHNLLEQGPCPQEHMVAINIYSAIEGRAEATCVHVRGGCPRGYTRMLFDGQCHENKEISIEAPGPVVHNQYGHNIVTRHGFFYRWSPMKVNDSCQVIVSGAGPGVSERRPNPPCGANNEGRCDLYEVEAEAPIPEI